MRRFSLRSYSERFGVLSATSTGSMANFDTLVILYNAVQITESEGQIEPFHNKDLIYG